MGGVRPDLSIVFVRLRQLIASNEAFARKLNDLDINVLDVIVTELMAPAPEHVEEPEQKIGFLTRGDKNKKRRRVT